jgi:hypothetical protein
MALNNSTIKDNYNSYEDWLEIYNPNTFPISLAGYKLTDDPLNPAKWVFTETVVVPAKGYLLVWASNRDTIDGSYVHTNFRLSAAGEFLGLSSPAKNYIDSITFGAQTSDISYGRRPDGGMIWAYYQLPTPGTSNDSTTKLPIPPPDFSHPSGIFLGSFQLTLSHPIGGARIYYTLDGSNPSPMSSRYISPLLIDSNRVIRVFATVEGRTPSRIFSQSYFIQPSGSLPILSIVTDPKNLFDPDSGIYIRYDSTGENWERFATLHYFERNPAQNFSIDCGIRIHGEYTRILPKKSFRFHFKSIYNYPKLNYKLFKNTNVEKFDEIILKSGSYDMVNLWNGTAFRDQLGSDLYANTKGFYSRGNYTRVYLNGQPFGIYNLRERINADFLSDYMGISDGDLRENWEQKLGDSNAWKLLWDVMWDRPVLDSTSYNFVESKIDIDNYIDYFAHQVYTGNFDWPHNNQFMARDRNEGKWKWILWDTDQTFGIYDRAPSNTLAWALRDTIRNDLLYYDYSDLVSATIFPRRLFSNETFKNKFIGRLTDLLNTSFQPNNVLRVVDSLKNHLNNDITFELNKWGSSYVRWQSNIDTIKSFIKYRVDSLRIYIRQQFGITSMRNITVSNSNVSKGTVWINNLHIKTNSFFGRYFKGMKITVSATPSVGYKFTAWTDTSLPKTATFTKEVTQDFYLQPIFEVDTSPISISANDVIINEYWLNDDGTRYPSIQNRPIQGTWLELLVTREGGVDMRGWRVTNNRTKTQRDPANLSEGSLIFSQIPQFSKVPKGTYILIITESKPLNDYYFPVDDLDYSDSTMLLYIRNGNITTDYDPFFKLRVQNDRIVLLHPGTSENFADDIGVDFISEGDSVTPATFGISANGVNFINPFVGIGDDDGAIFAFSAVGNYNNDNGIDPIPGDNRPGIGGWIVDPSKEFTGDEPSNPLATNILTPGKKNFFITTGVETENIPTQFVLYQNYPNPFNPTTRIRFSIPKAEKVDLRIYDILGQQITILVNGIKNAGTHEIIFNSSDYGLASGVYIYHITAGDYKLSKKMLLLK